MKKKYSVAEHIFEIILPDDCPLWTQMGQYDPFYTESTSEEAIFTLSLEEDIEIESKTLYFDQPTEPGETKIVIYKVGENWLFESSPTSQYPVSMQLLTNASFTKGYLKICDKKEALFALNNALMLIYAFRTSSLYTLEMHASVVQKDGKAYLFLAKSGTGKSTHSRMWLRAIEGSSLLNDDNPIVRVLSDGSVRVYGSPWSGKTPCYKAEDYPVGAFVQIKRAPENKAIRLDIINSYALVYASSSGIKFDSTMGDNIHRTINKLLPNTKCFTIECRPDEQAALVCYEAVR